jgi:hypothetical protein
MRAPPTGVRTTVAESSLNVEYSIVNGGTPRPLR